MKRLLIAAVFMSLLSSGVLAADKDKPQKVKGDDYVVASSTKIDFEDAMIEGKMQAPAGFFLQGKTQQSLDQMVKLRSNFKTELRNSKSGVKAIAK